MCTYDGTLAVGPFQYLKYHGKKGDLKFYIMKTGISC